MRHRNEAFERMEVTSSCLHPSRRTTFNVTLSSHELLNYSTANFTVDVRRILEDYQQKLLKAALQAISKARIDKLLKVSARM